MRSAWVAGRSALALSPDSWRDVAGQDASGEAALAALAGHAFQTILRPIEPERLAPRPLLPRLVPPAPPELVRSRLRRLLARKGEEGLERRLVLLVTARGFSMHPADWMPSARSDWAPDIYAPWIAWAASETAVAPQSSLTPETWGDWPWAERRAALADLRRSDPTSARAILAAKCPGEPAERRLQLLQLWASDLGPADAELLSTFVADRSDRVASLARQ